jgi:hypothetical protein
MKTIFAINTKNTAVFLKEIEDDKRYPGSYLFTFNQNGKIMEVPLTNDEFNDFCNSLMKHIRDTEETKDA